MSTIRAQGRFDALDTLRCLAVLFMVQGHTFYEVIDDSVRSQRWYGWHNYLHGYTAPCFLLGAGLAFGYTTFRSIDAHLTLGPAVYKRLWRYLTLIIIGYLLQLPAPGVHHASVSDASLQRFLSVDVLQHIGVVLLLSQALVFALRRRLFMCLATFALGMGAALAAPHVSQLPLELPPALASYLSMANGSRFPLLPWAGYVLIGIAVSGLLPRDGARVGGGLGLALAAAGLALVVASLGLDTLVPGAQSTLDYWRSSPIFFLRRMGWLFVLLGGLVCLDAAIKHFTPQGSGRVRDYVRLIGQHTLIVYVGHLLVLYGTPYSSGVAAYLSHSLGVWQGGYLVVLICLAMVLLLLAWERLDRDHGLYFGVLRKATVGGMAVLVASFAWGLVHV